MNEITVTISRDTVHVLAALLAAGYALFVAWLNYHPQTRQEARQFDFVLVMGGCGLIGLHLLAKHGERLFLSYLGSCLLFGLPMILAVTVARWRAGRRERREAEARRIEEQL